MNSIFYRTNKFIMLHVSIMLICCMMCLYIVIGLFTYTDYVHKKVNEDNHYSTSNVIENTIRIKDYKEQQLLKVNIIMIIQGIFDEELFKKRLSTYFNNSMLFAAFIEISMSSLLVELRNNRRRYFEETHYIYFLKLMKYIHQMDGERGNISLSYSF